MPLYRKELSMTTITRAVAWLISLLIAYGLAFTINRSNIKHKNVLRLLIALPMLIPSISHGLGLITLFGTNGLITKYISIDIIGIKEGMRYLGK